MEGASAESFSIYACLDPTGRRALIFRRLCPPPVPRLNCGAPAMFGIGVDEAPKPPPKPPGVC